MIRRESEEEGVEGEIERPLTDLLLYIHTLSSLLHNHRVLNWHRWGRKSSQTGITGCRVVRDKVRTL